MTPAQITSATHQLRRCLQRAQTRTGSDRSLLTRGAEAGNHERTARHIRQIVQGILEQCDRPGQDRDDKFDATG